MKWNKSKEKCIKWFFLHGLATGGTLQELNIQINKIQLYSLLKNKFGKSKKITKNLEMKKITFNTSLNSLEIPPISSAWQCN